MSLELEQIRAGVVGGAILHPADFAFSSAQDAFAERVRQAIVGLPLFGTHPLRVSLDEDGDILVEDGEEAGVAESYAYVLENQVNFQLANVPLSALVGAGSDLSRYAELTWRLYSLRELPTPSWFGVRLVVALPLIEPVAGELMRRHYLGDGLASLASAGTEGDAQCGLHFQVDGVSHNVLVTSDATQRAIVVAIDSGAACGDLAGTPYPAFAERIAPQLVEMLAQVARPVLRDARLDADFLLTGRQDPNA